MLWSAAVEAPGSRWWGFATTVDHGWNPGPWDMVSCLVVAGAWAVPTFPPGRPGELDLEALLGEAASTSEAAPLLAALVAVHPQLKPTIAELGNHGVDVIPLWTVVPAAPDLLSTPATGNER